MWLARLFGGRSVDADDEPARFAPPSSAKIRQPVQRAQVNVSNAKTGATPLKSKSGPAKSGFDPYNSGAFERGKAWERVLR